MKHPLSLDTAGQVVDIENYLPVVLTLELSSRAYIAHCLTVALDQTPSDN